MERIICDKCGYEACYNDDVKYEVIYLTCINCGEVIIDKNIEELKMTK